MKRFLSPFFFIKRHKIWSVVIFLCVLLIAFFLRPRPPILPDTQMITKSNLIQSVSVSGSIAADQEANLTFPIAGKLVYMGAKVGDPIKKYQTIALLDQRTLEQNLQNAEAALDNQQITFNNINDANGNRLLNDLSLSTSAWRQLKQATDTLTQAQIAVKIQEIAKEQSVLVSPIDGILTRADIDVPGTQVPITATYSVVDPKSLTFNMDVDEADVAKVAIGQLVKITLDAYPNDMITLPVEKIDFVSHTTSNGGNAFTVKVSLPTDTSYKFRVGMNGNADIVTAEKDNVLTVPLSAIADGGIVYVRVSKGYKKVKIKTGLQNDINAEVVSGLVSGDKVVLDPSKVTAKEIIN